ncbi:MAG: PilN domain-containing protein [Magnetococcales bacterium]|nr:PilN domain-containing protein [Magnetococcales bacterium]
MIATINLLPYRQARRLAKANRIIASWGGTFVATIAILFLIHLQFTGHLEAREAQARDNEAIIADLDKKLGEVKNIRELKKFIENKLKLIEELKQSRNLPVRIIDEVITALPEKSWLKGIQMQDRTLKLNGMAQSNAVVAGFMERLNASPFIDNVRLGQVSLNATKDKVKAFSLEASYAPLEQKKEEPEPGHGGLVSGTGRHQKDPAPGKR